MVGNIGSYKRYSDIPFNKADVFQVSEGNVMSCYVAEEDLARDFEEGALFLNRPKAQEYINVAKAQCQKHRDFFDNFKTQKLEKLSDQELLTYWQGLIDNYCHSVSYFRSTQEEPSRKIVSTVTDVVTPEEASLLLLSPELDDINKEEMNWEELVASGFTDEKAFAHIAKYPWLFQNSLTYEETVIELKQRLENHVSRNVAEEKEELKHKQAELLQKYSIPKEHIETLHELALLRPEVKACWAATGYYAAPLLQEIAKRKGIDLHTLAFLYRSEDIDELLATGCVLTESEVAVRKLCTAYELVDGTLTSYLGEEALELKKKVLGVTDKGEISEIKELITL